MNESAFAAWYAKHATPVIGKAAPEIQTETEKTENAAFQAWRDKHLLPLTQKATLPTQSTATASPSKEGGAVAALPVSPVNVTKPAQPMTTAGARQEQIALKTGQELTAIQQRSQVAAKQNATDLLTAERRQSELTEELSKIQNGTAIYTEEGKARAKEIEAELKGLRGTISQLASSSKTDYTEYLNQKYADTSDFTKALGSIGKTLTAAPGVVVETTKAAAKNTKENYSTHTAEDDEIAALTEELSRINNGTAIYTEEGKARAKEIEARLAELRHITQGASVDMNSSAMREMEEANWLQNEATEDIKSPVGKLLANTGLSIAQNAALLPTAALNPAAPLVAMGTIAGAQKMYDVSADGGSAGEALGRGVVAGGIEALTEKVPLDSLADLVKVGGKSAVKNLLKQAGVEATEEGLSYTMNYIADKAANDPNATWNWAEFAESVVSGGLSGLFFGLGGTVVNRVNSGTLPFDAKLAEENIKAKILPVESPASATEGQKNTASTEETEQIVSESNMQRFRTVIDGVFTGANPSGSDIVVGDTPSILQRYGAPNLQLRVTQNTVRKIVYPEGYMGGKHNLGMSAMKQLPYQIADPVAILKSKSQPNSIVLLTEWKTQEGQDVIVPIHLNKQGAVEAGNVIASAYGKGSIDALLGENAENVLYTKNNEDIHQLLSNGLQLPEAMADDVLAKNTIPQNEAGVNKEYAPAALDYAKKADGGTQALDANGPETTPKASLASSLSTSDTNVPQAAPGVNGQYMQDGARVFTDQTGGTDEGYWDSIMEEHKVPFSETDVDGYMESLLDAADQRLNRATPKGTAVTEEYEPANKGKKAKWDNERPSEIKEVKEIVDDPEVSGSKSITGEFAQALGSDGISYSKDLARNLDAAAGGKNTPLRAKLRDLIERPFNAAGASYSANVKSKLDDLKSTMDGLGIKKGSKESAAVQRYGEGRYQDATGEVREYTEAMLRKDFPDTWQNIVKAAQYCRQVYDSYVDRINAVLELIYPDPVSRAQEEADYHTGKASQYAQMAEEQQRTLNELQRRLDERKAQLAKTREGTQYYANLQNTIRRIEMQMERVQKKIDKCRGDADTHNAKAAAVQARIASGEVLRNKRLMKRADYFHHFNEMEKGWAGLINILTTPADIDSGLVGVSENTKPKSKWAGFLQGRKGGAYTEDAVGGLLAYIPMAEQKIAYDPVIAENRNIIKTLAQETEETCNANRFIEWMTDWTNDLAGKTNPYDRTMQKDWSRKTVAVAKWLSSRAKSNAVVGNVRSATAQVFNLPNALVYIKSPKAWKSGATIYAKAVAGDQTAKSLLAESGFLNQRYLDDAFSQFDEGLLKKPEKLANWMLTVGDKGVAKLIWASAYEQGRAQGVTDPVEYADDITRRSIAGRGIGEVPIKQKAAKTQLLSPFQIEVANTWQLQKEALKEKNLGGLFAMYVLTFLMNTVTRELLGYDVGFDPINAIIDGVQDWDEEETAVSNLMGIAGRLGGEILSARPGGAQLAMIAVSDDYTREKLFGDADPTRYGVGNIGLDALVDTGASAINAIRDHDASKLDLMTPLTNFLLPYGGKQVGRVIEGAQDLGLLPGATKESIARQPDAGSMTDNGGLRFAVDEKNPFDVAKLLALGPFSTKGGMEYLEEGYSALGESQTSAAMEAAKMGVDLVDYMAAYRGMSKAEKDAEKRAVIQNMDLTDEEKAYIYRYAMLNSDAKEKERTVFDSLVGGGSDAGLIGSTLMSMKDAEKQEGKLQAIGAAGVSEQEAKELFGMVMGTDLKTDQGNATAYAKLLDAMNTALGVQEVVELKNAGANFDNFLGYTGAGMDAGSAYDLSMAAVDMRNQEMIEGTFNLKENARWIESANLGKNEQEIAWLITYPEWAEKADKAGVSNWDYITYKKATYGLTKKFDKLKALRDAGYTATEAAQIYDKIN